MRVSATSTKQPGCWAARPPSSSTGCPAERLLAAAGTIWTPEQTWQLDQWGPDGHASVRMTQRPLVDPDAVRRAEVGEAWVIAAGRSLHLQIAETPYSPQPAELPTPDRDVPAVAEQRPPWVVDLPDQEPAAATVVAGELSPPQPALPPPSPELPRLRLQLATAVREGDELALRRVLKRAARVAPTWDAEAELAAVTAARRRRRRNQPPAWRGWLTRIAHRRRTQA